MKTRIVGAVALVATAAVVGATTVGASADDTSTATNAVEAVHETIKQAPIATNVDDRILDANPATESAVADTEEARELLKTSGTEIYAVPTDKGACFVSDDLVISRCDDANALGEIEDGTAAPLSQLEGVVCSPYLDGDISIIAGPVPSDITAIQATAKTGQVVDVPLDNGFAYAEFSKKAGSPSSLRFQVSGGAWQQASSPLPLDTDSTPCAAGKNGITPEVALDAALDGKQIPKP